MSERNGVVTYHLAVNMSEAQKMEMLYRVSGGVVQEEHYGLKLARVVPLPPDVFEHAQLVSQTLEQLSKKRKKRSLAVIQARRRKVLLNLKEQTVQVKNGRMEDEQLREWLKRLQDQFVVVMSALDEEAREIEDGVEEEDGGNDERMAGGRDVAVEE